jgi:hypothetical protein
MNGFDLNKNIDRINRIFRIVACSPEESRQISIAYGDESMTICYDALKICLV